MPWHGMDTTMPLLSLMIFNVPNHVCHTPLTILIMLDTALDEVVHRTRQDT
jgi:hypothetical protein